MPKPLITIVTVNYNTADFIELMLFAFKRLTKNTYKVLICDNGSKNKDLLKLAKVAQQYNNVEVVYRQQKAIGSIAHAEAMDILVDKVNTKYFVTMDSDCTFLQKHWDQLLIEQLTEEIKVIGTALPPTKNELKPKDFPLVFAVLYETETYKLLNNTFMPGDVINYPEQDTGWKIRKNYLANNYKGVVLDSENTRFTHNTVFERLICAVYYFNGALVASHFGRGSSNGAAKYKQQWWLRLPLISRVFRKIIGKRERRQWIACCNKIIDNSNLL